MNMKTDIDYERSVEIADRVFWIGFFDRQTGLHCRILILKKAPARSNKTANCIAIPMACMK